MAPAQETINPEQPKSPLHESLDPFIGIVHRITGLNPASIPTHDTGLQQQLITFQQGLEQVYTSASTLSEQSIENERQLRGLLEIYERLIEPTGYHQASQGLQQLYQKREQNDNPYVYQAFIEKAQGPENIFYTLQSLSSKLKERQQTDSTLTPTVLQLFDQHEFWDTARLIFPDQESPSPNTSWKQLIQQEESNAFSTLMESLTNRTDEIPDTDLEDVLQRLCILRKEYRDSNNTDDPTNQNRIETMKAAWEKIKARILKANNNPQAVNLVLSTQQEGLFNFNP